MILQSQGLFHDLVLLSSLKFRTACLQRFPGGAYAVLCASQDKFVLNEDNTVKHILMRDGSIIEAHDKCQQILNAMHGSTSQQFWDVSVDP